MKEKYEQIFVRRLARRFSSDFCTRTYHLYISVSIIFLQCISTDSNCRRCLVIIVVVCECIYSMLLQEGQLGVQVIGSLLGARTVYLLGLYDVLYIF